MDKIYKYTGGTKIVQLLLLAIAKLCWILPSVYSEGEKSIVLGPIESSLERKQVPVDLGRTTPALASRVGKALSLHGGLRLSDTRSSVFSANFSPVGSGGIRLELLKGNPKTVVTTLSVENESMQLGLTANGLNYVSCFLKTPQNKKERRIK